MRWPFCSAVSSAVISAVIFFSAGTLHAGLWDWHSKNHPDDDCPNCVRCDKESRLCAGRQFCPRGHCGFEETGCLRVDYGRYLVKGTEISGTDVRTDYYPRYRPRCRDFWVRDTAPCSHCR